MMLLLLLLFFFNGFGNYIWFLYVFVVFCHGFCPAQKPEKPDVITLAPSQGDRRLNDKRPYCRV